MQKPPRSLDGLRTAFGLRASLAAAISGQFELAGPAQEENAKRPSLSGQFDCGLCRCPKAEQTPRTSSRAARPKAELHQWPQMNWFEVLQASSSSRPPPRKVYFLHRPAGI